MSTTPSSAVAVAVALVALETVAVKMPQSADSPGRESADVVYDVVAVLETGLLAAITCTTPGLVGRVNSWQCLLTF